MMTLTSGGFVIPDMASVYVEIERGHNASDMSSQSKDEAERDFQLRANNSHRFPTSSGLRPYEKDKQYVVQIGKVMIVDENTGRLMPGRRWSNGSIRRSSPRKAWRSRRRPRPTLRSPSKIVGMYEKLAGMTGTAETEAGEFHDIYRLGVMVIPTHRDCIRKDLNDLMFKGRGKVQSSVERPEEAHGKGQPVLVGTASVESSEVFGRMLKGHIRHTVLNPSFMKGKRRSLPKPAGRGRYDCDEHGRSGHGHQIGRRSQGIGRTSGFGYGKA